MYEIKPTNTNPQDLCILTKPKQNGVVKMYHKDQPICSESRIEALESSISNLEGVSVAFGYACEINSRIDEIINDEIDTLFPGRDTDIFSAMDKLQEVLESKLKRIRELPGLYQMTKTEAITAFDEYGEPENQSPYGSGSPSLSNVIEDI